MGWPLAVTYLFCGSCLCMEMSTYFLSVLSVSHFALFSFQPKKFFINTSFTCLDVHLPSREVGLIVLVNLEVSYPE